MTLYQQVCHRAILPLGDLVLRQGVSRRFKKLLQFQWQSEQAIHQYRTQRLRTLLETCYRDVPFYQDFFDRGGLRPSDFPDLSALAQFPIVTKQVLRDSGDRLRRRGQGRLYKMTSSGSTGTPTAVWIDAPCFDEIYATQLLFWSWGGFAMGRSHLQTGVSPARNGVKRLKDLLFRCHYFDAFQLGDDELDKVVHTLRTKRIRYLFGYASSLYLIARHVQNRDENVTLDRVFSWGDTLFPHYRQLIEQTFACPVNDCYGLGEGLQCAAQCEEHGALHEAMHGVILEVVDDEGRPCRDGELGRVLVTRLEPGPMPLVRYDTGDAAYFVEGQCACGRNLRRISPIQGRCTDIVTTPYGERLIVHFFTKIFEPRSEVACFQVRQEKPGSIEIRYVPSPTFRSTVLDEIRQEILKHCKYPLSIEFMAVEEIPLEASNKRRFVISQVPIG